jgi:hypothetical protein
MFESFYVLLLIAGSIPGTDYVFINESGIRAISYDGTWSTKECVVGKQKGEFILNGVDDTEHRLEFDINGKYEHIYNTEFKYKSEITIDEKKGIIDRKYLGSMDTIKSLNYVDIKNIKNSEQFKKTYEDILDKRFKKNLTCNATFGRDKEDKLFLSFICPKDGKSDQHYIRVIAAD